MNIIYTKDLGEAFFTSVRHIADKLGCESVYNLLGVMQYESGLYAHKMNGVGSHAVGLIQFMPSTLEGLKWKGTPTQFAQLSAEDQLPFVEAYLKPWAPLPTVAHVYCAVFMPADVRFANDPNHVLTAKGGHRSWAFSQNANLDANGDNRITISELTLAVNRGVNAGWNRWNEVVKRMAIPFTPDWMQLQKPVDPASPSEIDLRTTRGIQQALVAMGYQLEIDGIPGPATRNAVREFQTDNKLVADSIPGPNTRKAMLAHLTALRHEVP